jgi:putative transposase
VAVGKLLVSERRACRLIDLDRSTCRYQIRKRRDATLRARIRELAGEHRRYGTPRLCVLLRWEGFTDNHKRIERIYREEGLQVIRRKRKRISRSKRTPKVEVPTRPDQRWSMDFVHDSTAGGRRFRCLPVVDEFTRECLHIEVATSIGGDRVTRVLDYCGRPPYFRVKTTPRFTHLST